MAARLTQTRPISPGFEVPTHVSGCRFLDLFHRAVHVITDSGFFFCGRDGELAEHDDPFVISRPSAVAPAPAPTVVSCPPRCELAPGRRLWSGFRRPPRT